MKHNWELKHISWDIKECSYFPHKHTFQIPEHKKTRPVSKSGLGIVAESLSGIGLTSVWWMTVIFLSAAWDGSAQRAETRWQCPGAPLHLATCSCVCRFLSSSPFVSHANIYKLHQQAGAAAATLHHRFRKKRSKSLYVKSNFISFLFRVFHSKVRMKQPK